MKFLKWLIVISIIGIAVLVYFYFKTETPTVLSPKKGIPSGATGVVEAGDGRDLNSDRG